MDTSGLRIAASFVQPPHDIVDDISDYLNAFEGLAKSENWPEIIERGERALIKAENLNRFHEKAKICAQLASTSFYQGKYSDARAYVNHCKDLSNDLKDHPLYLRALYLESAINRAEASKQILEKAQEELYQKAVQVGEEATRLFAYYNLNDRELKGKIYFNLGAAHADNPKGNLQLALECYVIARDCFQIINSSNDKIRESLKDDEVRTSFRIGKIYLLQRQYLLTQKIIDEARPRISNKRLAMHGDYLEAQVKFAINDFEDAKKIAERGISISKDIGAKEDQSRLEKLLLKINEKLIPL